MLYCRTTRIVCLHVPEKYDAPFGKTRLGQSPGSLWAYQCVSVCAKKQQQLCKDSKQLQLQQLSSSLYVVVVLVSSYCLVLHALGWRPEAKILAEL